ncbi:MULTISPECIES: hypothetical protein [Empedobacter]|uniref:Uncharacterized protein n=1 Tax=Empedobacter falsenii TaxID=343874 RepID=A0A7H9DRV3_9FLAO|nr:MULTISPECIES: hypothetical protein [Empedobacter]MDH2208379.1 hypothetical protein [Empedobacter sp. GD03644]MDM1549416.1 hypothetical protein [Empedobacter falsenii]QLL57854.1 hypothetical protein FH779_07080 [Empedobacter falsenii]
MKTKIYFLIIVVVSCLFYNCIEEEEQQIESINTLLLQRRDTISTNDSISIYSETEVNEADPPKEKDPYIKRTEEGGE